MNDVRAYSTPFAASPAAPSGDALRRCGIEIVPGFLTPAACATLLAAVAAYRATREPPLVERPQAGRSLRYRVIDGDEIHAHLPRFERLYADVHARVVERVGPSLVPLANRAASVNVNITPPGGEYRWHYDRNALTAIVYLNRVEGGETECHPDYRLHLGRFKTGAAQRWLDRLLLCGPVRRRFGRLCVVAPEPGLLLLMRGDRCLHSVRPVAGEIERVNVIMTFDRPGARFPQQRDLDPYLYTTSAGPAFDPNYVVRG
jgi:hypothetical protein